MASSAARKLNVVSDAKPPKATRESKADKDARMARINMRKRLACVIGVIASCVVGLSVVHVTDSVVMLTHSHWFLAMLLAIGIDAGMVASELAEIIAPEDETVKRWAHWYMRISIAASMMLNAFAFASHAETRVQAGACVVLGVVIPGLVFILGRIAGHLYNGAK